MEKATDAKGNPGGQGASVVRSLDSTAQTLAELGLTKDQSQGIRAIRSATREFCAY
jgi:hypothetical protein